MEVVRRIPILLPVLSDLSYTQIAIQEVPHWWTGRCNCLIFLSCLETSRRRCLDLCLGHNTDFDTDLIGSRTQFNVSYASAFLMPVWQVMTMFVCRAGYPDNVYYPSVDVSYWWVR